LYVFVENFVSRYDRFLSNFYQQYLKIANKSEKEGTAGRERSGVEHEKATAVEELVVWLHRPVRPMRLLAACS